MARRQVAAIAPPRGTLSERVIHAQTNQLLLAKIVVDQAQILDIQRGVLAHAQVEAAPIGAAVITLGGAVDIILHIPVAANQIRLNRPFQRRGQARIGAVEKVVLHINIAIGIIAQPGPQAQFRTCLLYTSDAADE